MTGGIQMTDLDFALILILILVVIGSVIVVWLNKPTKTKELPKN